MDYQNIFNRDFYPTPREVFDQMVTGENLNDAVILDPSAGSGNIINFCMEQGARYAKACEINDTLRQSLVNKCCVIASDFFTVRPEQITDVTYIIMNPPFSTAAKHVLHAWEVAPQGSTILTIYPTSHLKWCDSTEKKIKELVELFGSREDIGDAFNQGTAERRTGAEVSILRLYKPSEKMEDFDNIQFDFTPEGMEDAGNGSEGIIKYDALRDMVQRYYSAVAQFDAVQEASERINADISEFTSCKIHFGAHGKDGEGHELHNISRDRFRKELQIAAWRKIFGLLNMQKYSTHALEEKINRFIETSQARPFTLRNIYLVVNAIVQNIGNIMNECVVKAFDTICSLSADNSTAGEKWKTNSNYMVNQRFIVDCMDCEYERDYKTNEYNLRFSYIASYRRRDQVEDLYKALCFVCGKQINEGFYRPFENDIVKQCKDFGTWYYFDWFRVRFYKKGTMHFEFTDINVWYRFNQIAAQAKGWKIGSQGACKKSRVWRDIKKPEE